MALVEPECFLGLHPDLRIQQIYEALHGGGGSVSAEAVEAATFIAGYTEGDPVPLAVDKDSGGLLTHNRSLTAATDTVSLGGVQRTPTITVATTDGTVAAGSKSVKFTTSADFEGTLSGVAGSIEASESVEFIAPPGDTLAAISYTVTAGSVRIFRVA